MPLHITKIIPNYFHKIKYYSTTSNLFSHSSFCFIIYFIIYLFIFTLRWENWNPIHYDGVIYEITIKKYMQLHYSPYSILYYYHCYYWPGADSQKKKMCMLVSLHTAWIILRCSERHFFPCLLGWFTCLQTRMGDHLPIRFFFPGIFNLVDYDNSAKTEFSLWWVGGEFV